MASFCSPLALRQRAAMCSAIPGFLFRSPFRNRSAMFRKRNPVICPAMSGIFQSVCERHKSEKFRCVKTVTTPNFVLARGTGEAAASRRTLRVLRDLRRVAGHGIARAAVQARLGLATRFGRSGGIRRPLPRNARFEHSAPVEILARGQRSSCRSPSALTS